MLKDKSVKEKEERKLNNIDNNNEFIFGETYFDPEHEDIRVKVHKVSEHLSPQVKATRAGRIGKELA